MSPNYPGHEIAKEAFDVMMRRGWGVARQYPEQGGQWYVNDENETQIAQLINGKWCYPSICDDPFTALVEADRWYRENVET